MSTTGKLKEIVLEAIKSGKEISLKWDCGGDEAMIAVYLDGKELSYENTFAEQLDMYLLNRLDLPDVGEFSMKGGGKISLENNNLYLDYESRWKGYQGMDEDLNFTGWQEVDEIDEENTGKIKLFDE